MRRSRHDQSSNATIAARRSSARTKTRANRGRLIFAIDATASREETWDLAAQLTSDMFLEAAKIGGLDVQLVYYRGTDEVKASEWFADAYELVGRMGTIRCEAGATKIARVLDHIRTENARQKVGAAIFIGDAVEELPEKLYAAAAGLGVPVFYFQEGDGFAVNVDRNGLMVFDHDRPPQSVESVFRELARLTGGAHARFDAGAAAKLKELLQAVAAFAVGGVKALADLRTESARKLISQMK